MQMFDDWIRMKMWTKPRPDAARLVAPDGQQLTAKRDFTEDDIFFQVIEVGPQVEDVKIGNIICVSFLSSDMFRLQHPEEDFKSFTCRRGSVVGILRKQP